MKAIRLTRMDEARKSHDLWQLFQDLPEDSKARMEVDFPEIGSVLKKGCSTFGKWRYFEASVSGYGIERDDRHRAGVRSGKGGAGASRRGRADRAWVFG